MLSFPLCFSVLVFFFVFQCLNGVVVDAWLYDLWLLLVEFGLNECFKRKENLLSFIVSFIIFVEFKPCRLLPYYESICLSYIVVHIFCHMFIDPG